MNSGEAIKKVRIAVNMTQEEFAKAIGWAQSSLSECENNKRTPTIGNVNKVLKFAKLKKIKIKFEDFFPEDKE